MMKLKLICFLTVCLLITNFSEGQETYKGTLYSKLGQEITGEIKLNLQGANNDLIEISTTEKTKSKGNRQTLTTTSKLNTAIISHVNINGEKYYFRDIKIGYDEKFIKNACVKLILGTIQCGIFQSGDGNSENAIAIKFPDESLSQLVSVDFEFYNSSLSVAMRISKCKPLLEKMMAEDESVTWTEKASREQRIQRFKNIISDYNNCKLTD